MRPPPVEKNTGYSPFCNQMVGVCLRQEFTYWKGKLGPAHSVTIERDLQLIINRYG